MGSTACSNYKSVVVIIGAYSVSTKNKQIYQILDTRCWIE